MKNILVLIVGVIFFTSCQKNLDQTPQGVVSSEDLNTPANVDAMVIAAYSVLGNDHYTSPFSDMWPYGSLRGGDSYKGGDGAGDLNEFHLYETFSTNRVDNGLVDELWFNLYVGIGRANDALSRVNAMNTTDYPQKLQRQAEVRFIRAHFYFLAKILYKNIPYIDENISKTNYDTVANRSYSSDALWSKIAADFTFAAANLPTTQSDLGRINKYQAEAYLAKTLLYQAYQQDDNNNVIGVNSTLLAQVNSLCDDIINSGKYALTSDYAQNFLSQYRNNSESVFAIQYSISDGTLHGRLDWGHALNYPMNQQYGCCGFHVPSHDLINAFKTDVTGLPMYSTYNSTDVAASLDFQTNTFDPRLDHTVAIPGHPFKYKSGFLFDKTWARAPAVYDAFASLKDLVAYDDPSFLKVPPFMSSSKNWNVIRYADVLLFKAEALIKLNREAEALPLINQLRARAANSTALLIQAGPHSKFGMSTYQPGVNCTWTNSFAWQAMQWERRLEFATEGYHFFDLVRWGIAATYINAYFASEKTKAVVGAHLSVAAFKANRDEYFPIPLNQINFSKGLYKQNAGW